MLRLNLKTFLLFLVIIVFFILLKNSNFFDLGIIFRTWLIPQKSINTLFNPPDDLAEKYQELLIENSRLQTLSEENQQLKELLNFKTEKDYNLQVAHILSRDPINHNILIIDVGEYNNIKEGQAVVVNNGVMIGRVIEVGFDSAKVRLLTDKGTKLAVKIGNKQIVSGLLTGSLGSGMDLDYIPQELEIKEKDLVVTSDLDVKIPTGLVIGTIEKVNFSEGELFKQAIVSPLVDYNTLIIVAVITF